MFVKQVPEFVGQPPAAVKAFQQCRNEAKGAGVPFLFTFEEWWVWWQIDERWANRGPRRDQFIMARVDSNGPWSPTNVYCTTPADLRSKAEYEGHSRETVKAFRRHREVSKRHGVSTLFTFEEWWKWWQIDNRWANRGNGPDGFIMPGSTMKGHIVQRMSIARHVRRGLLKGCCRVACVGRESTRSICIVQMQSGAVFRFCLHSKNGGRGGR